MTNATDYAAHVSAANSRITAGTKTGISATASNQNLQVAIAQGELASASATMALADAVTAAAAKITAALAGLDEAVDGGTP